MKPILAAPIAVVLVLLPVLTGCYGLVPDSNPNVLMQPIWAACACVLLLATGVAWILRPIDTGASSVGEPSARFTPIRVFGFLVAWSLVCLLARLIGQHGMAYTGPMLRGGAILAAEWALFWLCRKMAQTSRPAFYMLLIAAVCGGAIAAAVGANEYMTHVRQHELDWRVFGPSTPDFLAGYLVLLIPLTLALFLTAPPGSLLPFLLGLITVMELVTMLTTGSRFAVVSLTAGLLLFGAALLTAVRRGLDLHKETRTRLLVIGLLLALAAVVAARPVLHRIMATSASDNSTAFRLWTWRGAARMALENPIFGTGPGIWQDIYPQYALTGFTRLAHNSYLQMADECGLVGGAGLVALLITIAVVGVRGLAAPLPDDTPSLPDAPPISRRREKRAQPASPPMPPIDDRLLLCGLLGSLAAGAVQNIIDSDWYVFFIGLTYWALAGLTVGLAARGRRTPSLDRVRPWLRTVTGCGVVVLLAYFISQGVAAFFGKAAHAAADLQSAETDYTLAGVWDPFGAGPRSELGYGIYPRLGNLLAAETLLREAVAREPSDVNYHRLAMILEAAGKPDVARMAYRQGLAKDPQSLDFLLALARLMPVPGNLDYFRRIAALEESPVGQIRALGGLTEVRFALADSALGDAAVKADPGAALGFYVRAVKLLESYADEGGAAAPQRQAISGGRDNVGQDVQMRALYRHVAAQILRLSLQPARPEWQLRTQAYGQKYDMLVSRP